MNINSVSSPSFCGFDYLGRYIKDKQDTTHDVIRAHLEDSLGPYIFYYDELEKEKMPFSYYSLYMNLNSSTNKKAEKQVDEDLINQLKIPNYRKRRQGELYSGAELSFCPEKLEGLKQAGVNSVFCLVPVDDYKEAANEAGLNYGFLNTVCRGLSFRSINDGIVNSLIKSPELWVEGKEDAQTMALKTFVETLNGKNPDLPLPIYFGCHNGTDRTVLWFMLYDILKDAPYDKPLSDKKIEQLAEFAEIVCSSTRP